MEDLLRQYGYLAILVGTFLEGETILVLGGFAASSDLLRLDLVMVSAFVGSLLGDQLAFFIGRWKGRDFVARRPRWQAGFQKVEAHLIRHDKLILLGFRFLYGLRNVVPFALGASRIPVARFGAYNLIGAAIWAITVAAGGYFFGEAMEHLLGDIKRYTGAFLVLLVLVGLFFWYRRRKRQTDEQGSGEDEGPQDRLGS